MNLVNDLLLEAERRRSATRPAVASPLDELVAVRERPSEHRAKRRPGREPGCGPGQAERAADSSSLASLVIGAAGFVIAGLALGAGFLASTSPLATRLERIVENKLPVRLASTPPPPSVAARPAPAPESVEPAPPPPAALVPAGESTSTPPIESPSETAPMAAELYDDADEFVLEELDGDTGGDGFGGARVIVPSLGDPQALSIQPSRRDRERAEERALRAERDRLLRIARAAREGGRREEAAAAFEQTLALDPDDESVLVELCEVIAGLGRSDEAIARLETARARSPRSRPLLLGQAQLLAHDGDLTAAIRLLDASELGPTEAPDVHALAAAYLQRSNQHERAIERYEQILRRFPEESRAWLGLGISLEATGRQDEARDVYRIALSVGELPMSTRSWISGRLAASVQER